MNWQEYIVIIILAICLYRIARHFFRFFRDTEDGKNMCEQCTADCALRSVGSSNPPCNCEGNSRKDLKCKKKKNKIW